MTERSLDDGAMEWLSSTLCQREEALAGQFTCPLTTAGIERLRLAVIAVNLHDEMVEALRAAEEHLQFVASSRCEAGRGHECGRSVCQHVGCLAEKRRKVSAALSKSNPTQKWE